MICRTKEIEIPQDNPFLNCKLQREAYAIILTKVISQLEEGGVLSICGEWGTGKTTFVKMWEQQLKNQNFQTLYFNVWEHDFMSDPLIGIITQFRKLVPNDGAKQKLAEISKSFMTIVTGMAPKIAKGIATHYIGAEAAEAIEAGMSKASDSFDAILNKFEEQSNSINEFKDSLRNYVDLVSPDKPIIFIVDELDRCNPHYAVKTLERIKHLFNIPGIIFVLSIDKEQLCNSIKGYFGSEQLDAKEYLKRFIDFEYQLPKPTLKRYCQYLYGLYGFDQFFESEQRKNYSIQSNEREDFLQMAVTLYSCMNINLRQIEKQFTHLRIAIQSFRADKYVHPDVIVLLEYFRQKHYDFYNRMYHKQYTIDELVERLEEYLPNTLLSYDGSHDAQAHSFMLGVSKLICCYAEDDINRSHAIKLVTEGNESKLLFKCNIFNQEHLLSFIKFYTERAPFQGIFDIRVLMDHLELLNDFIVN